MVSIQESRLNRGVAPEAGMVRTVIGGWSVDSSGLVSPVPYERPRVSSPRDLTTNEVGVVLCMFAQGEDGRPAYPTSESIVSVVFSDVVEGNGKMTSYQLSRARKALKTAAKKFDAMTPEDLNSTPNMHSVLSWWEQTQPENQQSIADTITSKLDIQSGRAGITDGVAVVSGDVKWLEIRKAPASFRFDPDDYAILANITSLPLYNPNRKSIFSDHNIHFSDDEIELRNRAAKRLVPNRKLTDDQFMALLISAEKKVAMFASLTPNQREEILRRDGEDVYTLLAFTIPLDGTDLVSLISALHHDYAL